MGKYADLATKDLTFIHNWILSHHPGPVEKKCSHPQFEKWFEKGFKRSINRAKKVTTKKESKEVVQFYVKNFNDMHLRLEPISQKKDKILEQKDIASIKEIDNICWVTIKSFYPRTPRQKKQLKVVAENIKHYRKSEIIVFDFRGVEGGYTAIGIDIINNLFSKKYINSIKNYPYRTFSMLFRVSKTARKELEKIVYAKNQETRTKRHYNKILTAIKKGEKNDKDLVRVHFGRKQKTGAKVPSPVKANVYVLTEGGRSAALLIMDRLFSIKGVVQVGMPTGKDTLYGECNDVKLPSGHFKLLYPNAVRDYLIRKNDQRYIPKHRYNGDISNTKKVREWIVNLNKKLHSTDNF